MNHDLEALIAEARDPSTPFERLEALVKHPEVEVRRALLANPHLISRNNEGFIYTYLLTKLAREFPEEVAIHPMFVLHALVEPDEAMMDTVKHVVQRTSDVGLIGYLWRTWGPTSWWVRQGMALNPSTPPEVLLILGNRGTESDGYVRKAVASNPNTPEDTLRLLGNQKTESEWTVRVAVASNPHTPEDTLQRMSNAQTEPDEDVREAAMKALAARGLT